MKVSPMFRSHSPVTTAAAAAVLAMTAFALWTGVRAGAAETCFGPGCSHVQSDQGGKPRRSLGLIDL